MTQFEKLVAYTNARLATAGLVLSDVGLQSMLERFNKSEANGGYSDYWKNL